MRGWRVFGNSELTFRLRHGSQENALFLVALTVAVGNGVIACLLLGSRAVLHRGPSNAVGCLPHGQEMGRKKRGMTEPPTL